MWAAGAVAIVQRYREIGWTRGKMDYRIDSLRRLLDRAGKAVDVTPPAIPTDPLALTARSLRRAGYMQWQGKWMSRDAMLAQYRRCLIKAAWKEAA